MFDELNGWMVGKVSLSLEERPGWMLPGGQTTGDWRGSQAPGVEIPPARKCCRERTAATYILGGRVPRGLKAVTHQKVPLEFS